MMVLKSPLLVGLALVGVVVSAPAEATILTFQLTGSRDATFNLNSDRIPNFSSTSAFGDQIAFSNVSGTFGGVAGKASSVGFGTGSIFASLNIVDPALGFTQFAGPSLFSGAVTAPVFAIGTYSLTSIVSGSSTLTISNGVPEPTSWVMLIVGMGGLGAFARASRKQAATTA